MSKIIFALDGPVSKDLKEMTYWATVLRGKIGMVKVGLKAYVALGPTALKWASVFNVPIMLDLKLHDIPNTMKEAVQEVVRLIDEARANVKYLTVHSAAGPQALRWCVDACKDSQLELVAVTELTSLVFHDSLFRERVAFAKNVGIGTYVCSPNEVQIVKHMVPDATVITPGIRFNTDEALDQVRANTPKNAVKNGADWLVVGRPIRGVSNPVEVVTMINRQVEEGMAAR